MLRGLYDWTLSLAARKSAEWWLAFIAFVESSVFLVPADAAGLTKRDFPRLGGGRACNLDLRDVHVPADALLGDGADALPAIEAVVVRPKGALRAADVGTMRRLFAPTPE